jgi:SAM-dependent methyltransferase
VKDYVSEYFDRNAERWVEAAYAGDSRFPIGPERIRIAVDAVAAGREEPGTLVDLGCGGGQLCVHAAQLGWRVVGVDVAPSMIEEAERLTRGLGVRFVTGAYDENGLPDESFDAVTVLGLLEYLPADDGLFAEAARLLHSGGRLAVSCRNRLYNLQSANRYTARELEAREAPALLEELERTIASTTAEDLYELAAALALAGGDLARATETDRDEPPPELHDHTTAFEEARRQHTPSEVDAAAERAGLKPVEVLAVHPHPLPPVLERLSPRFYNRLALAWQRPLERSGLGLAVSSAFVSVFEKP